MKSKKTVFIILALSALLFIYFICSWTILTTTGTVTIPGEGVYKGQMKNGNFHGEGTWESELGCVYTGSFKNGKYDGQGTITFLNGAYYTGGFKEGYMHGYGVMTFADGHTHEGEWDGSQFQTEHECDHEH